MELIKKQIHMNQWKGNAVTQITLDEDFIVPDTLEDMDQVILDNARIIGENGRIQDEKMTVKGKMEFADQHMAQQAITSIFIKCTDLKGL